MNSLIDFLIIRMFIFLLRFINVFYEITDIPEGLYARVCFALTKEESGGGVRVI